MKRKDYERPKMLVVELKNRYQVLTGSPLNKPSDYPNGGDPFSN